MTNIRANDMVYDMDMLKAKNGTGSHSILSTNPMQQCVSMFLFSL